MFLRSADGTQYLNSEKLTRLSVVANGGTYDVEGRTTGTTSVLASGLASQSAARVARDKVVSVLRGTSEGDAFLTHYQLDILFATQAIEILSTFNGGAGSWQVRADGNNLVVSLADQSAATASMDAIAAAVGSLDVAELVA